MPGSLWEPSPERIAQANITAFAAAIEARHGVDADSDANREALEQYRDRDELKT
ncbi:MAG: hypothetical protein IT521_01190 [Burkholderiales bacterium]|nr:hypothetical protein [Burkholderiales bacterium]